MSSDVRKDEDVSREERYTRGCNRARLLKKQEAEHNGEDNIPDGISTNL